MWKDKKGQSAAFAAVIPLVLIFGTAIVVAVLMSTVAAQVYSSALPWQGINNATISADVNAAVENSFEAYNQATSNLDLLAIIAVASAVLMGIGGFFFASRGVGGGGGAL